MKKVVIFDFDGTLADSFPLMVKILKKRVKEMGYPELTNKQIEVMRSMRPLDIIKHFKFPIWKVPKLIKTVREDLFKQVTSIKLFSGIRQLIDELGKRNLRYGILTSNSIKAVDSFLKYHNLRGFEFIESETNIFRKSTHLIKIIKKYFLNKQEVIYVGDEVRDIIASQEAGIDVIAVTWGYNKKEILKQNNPTFIVDKPSNILKFI